MDKKKIVVHLEVQCDKGKQKAMNAVSSLPGIESISVDMKDRKLTVIGDVDPVCIVKKLQKCVCGHVVILTVGPAKDPKEEEKKKKEAEEKKKKEAEEKKKKEEEEKRLAELAAAYKCYIPYCPPGPPPYWCRPIYCEENPYSCVIM